MSLFLEIGTSQGNVETRDATADPPATTATRAGRAQQRRVPVDVKRARKLITFLLMSLNLNLPPYWKASMIFQVRLKKDLGQHILVSGGVLRRLVEFLEVSEGDTVVEIGGGTGNLTRELLKTPLGRLITLEIDPRMVEDLKKIEDKRLKVLQADATSFDLCSLGENLKVIGNLPYNVASLILENTVRCRSCVPIALYTVQKEVGLKVAGKTDPGWLTVFVKTFFEVEYLMSLPPKFFFPRPRVESGVIRLRRKDQQPDLDLTSFKRFLTRLFSSRKKKLKNVFPQDALREVSIDPDLRLHQLSPGEILRLYNVLG